MASVPGINAFWSRSIADLLGELHSSPKGLSEADAGARYKQYGPNLLKTKTKSTPLVMFLSQFKQPIVLILIAATLVSGITGEWVDAGIIMAIVMGSSILSFYQEYSANHAVEKLQVQVQVTSNVLRDGSVKAVRAEHIVPGDVVVLAAGSLVPADGVLIEEDDLYVSQAALTGETYPAEKNVGVVPADAELAKRTNCVFMGTNVRSGKALALVVDTGSRTVFGEIAAHLTLRPPETEFEHGIKHFGYLLTEVTFVLVLVIFAVNVFLHQPILESLLFSVALALGVTPQMLPAIISITLSKGSQKMAANGVIVKRLAAIESFGSMDTLCTDKTGTLTEGVVSLDSALDAQGQPSEAVLRYAYLNAHFETGLPNPLDEAIKAGAAPDITGVTKLDEEPYDFIRKRLSVAVQDKDQRVFITKGALDNIVEVCTHFQVGSQSVPLEDVQRDEIEKRMSDWSAKGFRVLGVATRIMEKLPPYNRTDEHDMTFIGFLLFFDPPKPSVVNALGNLASLGVTVKIITGDNHLVAQHVAEAVGLKVAGIVTGTQLDTISDDAYRRKVEQCNLFTEVDPNQKERIVLALKRMGHVVGYMGDGINDAPALHTADVGISVSSAVDVAKEAADFVLLQQDLDVLRQGIEEGRRTFANTMKYIFITTSANFGNMFSMAGASLFLPFLPMLPKQILLTNFLTDFPAVTMAADSVDPEMVNKPHRWNIKFIRNFMLTFGLVSSLFDYLTFGTLLFIMNATETQFQTGWYLESTITELLILLVIRTQRPFWRSKPARILMIAVLAVAVVTFVLPFSPLNQALGMAPLPLPILAILGGIAVAYVGASELAKRYFFRHAHW